MNQSLWPTLITAIGVSGVVAAIINAIVNRRKLGADTTKVFTDAAATMMRESHADNQLLRADNRSLREDNQRLTELVHELRVKVERLEAQLTRVQTDVSATRTAVERQQEERRE